MIDSRISDRFKRDVGFELEPHLIVLATVGSHSHGTYIEPTEPNAIDDVDLMGFVVPPVDYLLGLPRWETWRVQVDELDVVLYSLEKAFRMLLKSNPNIVGTLWLRPEFYVYQGNLFSALLRERHIFTALTAADAFAGYAYGQLKRMEAFNVERMNEYEVYTTILRGKHPDAVELAVAADSNKLKHLALDWDLPQDWLKHFVKLHKQFFSGYMGEKRKAMVRAYEYDVKNAAHLIRLLRMGKEFLETGELNVYRTHDAEELMSIKRGEWTLAQVKAEAEQQFAAVRAAEAASQLPKRPDEQAANELLIWMQQGKLGLY